MRRPAGGQWPSGLPHPPRRLDEGPDPYPPRSSTMTEKTSAPRRRFLQKTAAAAGGATALAAPMIAVAQTTTLKFQSTWPAKDIFHEYALDFAKKVNDMAGGRLKIEVLPAGS